MQLYANTRCLVYGVLSSGSCGTPLYGTYPILLSICLFHLMKCNIRTPQTTQICSHLWSDSVCWKELTYGQRPLSFAAWWTWAHWWSCQNGWCPQMAGAYCRLITMFLPFPRWVLFAVEACKSAGVQGKHYRGLASCSDWVYVRNVWGMIWCDIIFFNHMHKKIRGIKYNQCTYWEYTGNWHFRK